MQDFNSGLLAGRILSTHGSIIMVPKEAAPMLETFDIRNHRFINRRHFIGLLTGDRFLIDEVSPQRAAALVKSGEVRADDFYFVAVNKE